MPDTAPPEQDEGGLSTIHAVDDRRTRIVTMCAARSSVAPIDRCVSPQVLSSPSRFIF